VLRTDSQILYIATTSLFTRCNETFLLPRLPDKRKFVLKCAAPAETALRDQLFACLPVQIDTFLFCAVFNPI
jgi:hypothetical protein